MSDQNNNSYKAAFFIVPSYILDLPGLTLGFLKVFETIFQFWNHKLPCYLSDEKLMKRTNLKSTQVYDAFLFFEKHGELIRIKKNGKRHLTQPQKTITSDCTENEPTSAPPDVRYSGSSTSAVAEHNIKKVNKEEDLKTPCAINIAPKASSERFDEFWNLYPSKKGKKSCLEKWTKRKLDTIADDIIEKLREQAEHDDSWKRGYCPNPLTYINQDRWNDELSQPRKSTCKSDPFHKYIKSTQRGTTYDQHGSTYDPFR